MSEAFTKSKHVVTIVLLIFVVASVTFLVCKESKEESKEPPAEETADGNPVTIDPADVGHRPDGQGHVVIAYYFHTTKRCPTCRKIEAYTTESIESEFAAQLQSGILEFHIVNVDEPENRHYIYDYQLTTKSVILADYRDGKQVQWKNLQLVWRYVGKKQIFMDYIKDETEDFLGEFLHE